MRGDIDVDSDYLKDSVGMNDVNLDVSKEIAIAIKTRKGPWVIGGDWNDTPATRAGSS